MTIPNIVLKIVMQMVSPESLLFTYCKSLCQAASVHCMMISEEGSPQKADDDSFPTDILNTNDWIDEQSRNMMNIELSKS